jgi:hypothetical protein
MLKLVGEITTVFDENVQNPKYKVCKNVESCHVKSTVITVLQSEGMCYIISWIKFL